MPNTNGVREVDEVRRLIPVLSEKYGVEVNLGSAADFDDAYAAQQLPYANNNDAPIPLLDQWFRAYEISVNPAARLSKEQFAVVAACLSGWAGEPIIFGEGDRTLAWAGVLELCGLKGTELRGVFNAMDSITAMS